MLGWRSYPGTATGACRYICLAWPFGNSIAQIFFYFMELLCLFKYCYVNLTCCHWIRRTSEDEILMFLCNVWKALWWCWYYLHCQKLMKTILLLKMGLSHKQFFLILDCLINSLCQSQVQLHTAFIFCDGVLTLEKRLVPGDISGWLVLSDALEHTQDTKMLKYHVFGA